MARRAGARASSRHGGNHRGRVSDFRAALQAATPTASKRDDFLRPGRRRARDTFLESIEVELCGGAETVYQALSGPHRSPRGPASTPHT